jgi:hypothetical protein
MYKILIFVCGTNMVIAQKFEVMFSKDMEISLY